MIKYFLVIFLITFFIPSIYSANNPLEIIQPQEGLDTTNRYYKAYPGLEYNVRLGVIGGVYPFTYELTDGPQGMNINENTGEITWPNPTQSGSPYSVSVRVTDQEGSIETVSWTITVTTDGFFFVDAINGQSIEEGGDGSISNPWKSLRDVSGGVSSTKFTIFNEDSFIYWRDGEYLLNADMEDCPGACRIPWYGQRKSNVWLAYPGETPSINMNSGGFDAYIMFSPSEQLYLDGFNFNVNTNTRGIGIMIGNDGNTVIRNNHFEGLNRCDHSGTNTALLFISGGFNPYTLIQDNSASDSNCGYWLLGYDSPNTLVENNDIVTMQSLPLSPKTNIQNWTIRANYIEGYTNRGGIHVQEFETHNNLEISHNIVKSTQSDGVALGLRSSSPEGLTYVYRNTFLGHVVLLGPDLNKGPFYFSNNVIINDYLGSNKITCGEYSEDCDEFNLVLQNNLVGDVADNIVDSNGLLTGSYRDTYLGSRGHEISSSSSPTLENFTCSDIYPLDSSLIFCDDFETGDLSSTNNGFNWRDSTGARVNSDNSLDGANSLRFTFGGSLDIHDDSWAEQRFEVGSKQKEIWTKYDLYIPNNYYHRSPAIFELENVSGTFLEGEIFRSDTRPQDFAKVIDFNGTSLTLEGYYSNGNFYQPMPFTISSDSGGSATVVSRSSTPTNNKGLINFWNENYTGATHTAFHFYASRNPEFSGDSVITSTITRGGNMQGHISNQLGIPGIDTSEDNGKWHEFIMKIRIADLNVANGVAQVWKNGELIYSETDLENWNQQDVLDEGYLLGWANSGFDEDTVLYLDNFLMSSNSLMMFSRFNDSSYFNGGFPSQGGSDVDTTSPSQVSGLSSLTQTSNSISLSWSAASDNVGVEEYNIYRDNSLIDTTSSLNYVDSGLSSDTQYSYQISALDGAGNEGARSSSISVSTLVENTEPGVRGVGLFVDSTYDDPLYNKSNLIDDDLTTDWASSDSSVEHFIMWNFSSNVSLDSLELNWAFNDQTNAYMSVSLLDISYWDGSAYVDLTTIEEDSNTSVSVANFNEISTNSLRFTLESGNGNEYYNNILWLSEISYSLDDEANEDDNQEDDDSGSSSSSGSSNGGGGSSSSSSSSSSSGSSGSGSQTDTETPAYEAPVCVSDIEYSDWSECVNGEQFRVVSDNNLCRETKTETRMCEAGLDENALKSLNAKELKLSKISDKRYQSELTESYNEMIYTSSKLDDDKFILVDNATQDQYLGRLVEQEPGKYYYTLELVDANNLASLKEEGLAQKTLSERVGSAFKDFRESRNFISIMVIFTLFGITTIIYFITRYVKRIHKTSSFQE